MCGWNYNHFHHLFNSAKGRKRLQEALTAMPDWEMRVWCHHKKPGLLSTLFFLSYIHNLLTQREKPWEPCGNLVSANRLKSRQNTPKKREREKQEVTQNGIDSIVLNRSKCIQMCNKSLNLSQNVISSTESLASLIIDKWAFCNWVRWMWWAKGGNKGEGRRESS